jgi:hypothetical protein
MSSGHVVGSHGFSECDPQRAVARHGTGSRDGGGQGTAPECGGRTHASARGGRLRLRPRAAPNPIVGRRQRLRVAGVSVRPQAPDHTASRQRSRGHECVRPARRAAGWERRGTDARHRASRLAVTAAGDHRACGASRTSCGQRGRRAARLERAPRLRCGDSRVCWRSRTSVGPARRWAVASAKVELPANRRAERPTRRRERPKNRKPARSQLPPHARPRRCAQRRSDQPAACAGDGGPPGRQHGATASFSTTPSPCVHLGPRWARQSTARHTRYLHNPTRWFKPHAAKILRWPASILPRRPTQPLSPASRPPERCCCLVTGPPWVVRREIAAASPVRLAVAPPVLQTV